MIKTSIIIDIANNTPIWLPHEGLAVSVSIAKWLFKFCGWKREESNYPDLTCQVDEVDWADGDLYFPCETTQLWILGSKLHLN